MTNLWFLVQRLFQRKEREIVQRTEICIQNYSENVPIGGSYDLIALTVPARCSIRLISFGNYSGTTAAWGTVYWDFLVDGSLIYPYSRIMDPLGYSGARQSIQGVYIPGGHTLIIRAYNPTAAICAMGISLEYELSSFEEG
ncbi:MAG: hypothetical protein MUP81_01910 [Dehalococcoidia bacterium]|nr:hypothetical protein [Dehalococcoidia bacterium]